MADIEKLHNAHLEKFGKTAHINSMEEYKRLYRRSIENPDEFWAEQAKTGILHLGLKVVYTFRKPEVGQSYSVGNN